MAAANYNRFNGKVAVVTGGGNGIGEATVRRFALEGASVVIADIDENKGNALAKELPRTVFVRTDVLKLEDCERVIKTAVEKFGGLDILFSNAGIQTYGQVEDVTAESYEKSMGVNFKGHVFMCKYAIPALRKRGGGAIVCSASVQAFTVQTTVPLYAASKAATVTLVKGMALDHAHEGIRVNAICPGSVDTPMLRFGARSVDPNNVDATIAKWGKMHPIGRVIQAEEVAAFVAFLCSDEAKAITGVPHLIDGGLMTKLPVLLDE